VVERPIDINAGTMRFFPLRKKEEEPDIEVQGGKGTQIDDHRDKKKIWSSEDAEKAKAQQSGVSAAGSQAQSSTKSKSLGVLVRKLNCAAHSKTLDLDNAVGEREVSGPSFARQSSYNPALSFRRASSWGGPLRKNSSQSEITRPVLITVNDGDIERSSDNDEESWSSTANNASARAELKSSFIVGLPTSTTLGSSQSNFLAATPPRSFRNSDQFFASESFAGLSRSPSTTPSRSVNLSSNSHSSNVKNNSTHYRSKWLTGSSKERAEVRFQDNEESLKTAREIARKERWKRGLQMEKQLWNNKESSDEYTDDTSINTDSVTQASTTTGFTSAYTTGGYSTYTDDSTDDATETDESYYTDTDGSSFHYRSIGNSALKRSARQLTQYHGRQGGHQIKGGPCSSNEQVMLAVKEDFGIIVGLLWSDGAACLGAAAAITKETVTSCKEQQ